MKDYTTLKNKIFRYEFVVEKSRFISFACRVSTVGQANSFIESICKQYYDATHNCYAYFTEEGQKFSDDGEPQGTAGMPILNAIKGKELFNVAVVVTRYFGGIKLGAGGLVRAYGKAANSVLDESEKMQFKECSLMQINCDYTFASSVESAAIKYGKIVDRQYLSGVSYSVAVPTGSKDGFVKKLSDATQGKVFAKETCVKMIEF